MAICGRDSSWRCCCCTWPSADGALTRCIWQAAVGRRLALHSFLRSFFGDDVWNVSLAFWKGFLRHETIAALVDGHIVMTRLTRDRVATD
jgi:hypothetical protein